MPRLLVVDDLELFRRRTVVALERDPGVEVLAEVGTIEEALAAVGAAPPDVAVVAASLEGASLPHVVALLRAASPGCRVVLLHGDDPEEQLLAASLGDAVDRTVDRDRVAHDPSALVATG